jgi:putative flippase GtrA
MKNTLLGDAIRYYTVGACAAASDFTVYVILVRTAGLSPPVAHIFSRPIGGVVGFILNRLWTFRRRRSLKARTQFVRFWIVWLVSFCLSEALVIYFHVVLGLGDLSTKICAEAITGIMTFLLQRYWTFR